MDELKITILIVEDEALIAASEEMQLKQYGYGVVTANCGEEAIATVNSLPDIDIILMDIDLGKGMDGTVAAREIQKHHDIPIMFLSSHTEKEIIDKTEQITSYGYLVKSAGITVLDASIKMALRLYEATRMTIDKNAEIEAANDKLTAANEQLEATIEELQRSESDLMERERILAENEERFRSLFMSMSDGFYLSEVLSDEQGRPYDYRFVETNPAFEKMVGLTREQLIGKTYKDIVTVDTTHWLDTYFTVAETGEPLLYEFESPEYNTTFETYSYRPRMGQVTVLVRDISERKRAENAIMQTMKENTMLMQELQHRVKNNMTMISAMLGIEMNNLRDDTDRAIFKNMQNRISSMAFLYEQLYTNDRRGSVPIREYIVNLVSSLATSFVDGIIDVNITTEIDDIELDMRQAVPLGLIINELVTNALKHAYYAGLNGEIRLTLTHDANEYALTVSDDGKGLPKGSSLPSLKGMGLKLVDILVNQLKGTVFINGVQGTTIRISFPDNPAGR